MIRRCVVNGKVSLVADVGDGARPAEHQALSPAIILLSDRDSQLTTDRYCVFPAETKPYKAS